jgi:tRNA pseudouridine38-40 synthase
LAYDGTDFAGWARQPGRRTVQGSLEDALRTVLRHEVQLTVAGRTDAGVHATDQVAHVDVPTPAFDGQRGMLARRLNGLLPPDVRIRSVMRAPEGFDARFSALSRRYLYRVSDGWTNPLRRRDTLAHPRPLDVEAMNAAAELLQGERDFAAYCKRREGASTVRRLIRLAWERDAEGVAVATVEADAFCHNMVRSLVGAMLAVGDGRRPIDWPGELLGRCVRDPAVTVVPAHGLTLAEVRYPPDAELAEQARRARRRRDRSEPGFT